MRKFLVISPHPDDVPQSFDGAPCRMTGWTSRARGQSKLLYFDGAQTNCFVCADGLAERPREALKTAQG